MSAHSAQPIRKTARPCLLGRDCEHVRRQIEAGDAEAGLRQLESDPARSDADLENLAARAAREIEVERYVASDDWPIAAIDRIVAADVQRRPAIERPPPVIAVVLDDCGSHRFRGSSVAVRLETSRVASGCSYTATAAVTHSREGVSFTPANRTSSKPSQSLLGASNGTSMTGRCS
jgi:hypothetical protein